MGCPILPPFHSGEKLLERILQVVIDKELQKLKFIKQSRRNKYI